MPDHAKEYYFDVIEITMRANESCFDEFEFRKTFMKVLKLTFSLSFLLMPNFNLLQTLQRVFFEPLFPRI